MEAEEDVDTTIITEPTTLNEEAVQIIQALGGQENIESVTACATRLRVAVDKGDQVKKQIIKNLGATAVFEVKGGIQAVFGGKADLLSQEINQILGMDD